MARVTRRTFLSAAGAIPFAVWLERNGLAQPANPRVRYDARSPQGIQMLGIYASAVGKMMDANQIPEGDPRSWTFQWYTHFVSGSTTKNAEIQRVYPNGNEPNRAVAQAMWNTCQAHIPGETEDFFVPWHRCFVFYFEQIIAAVSGRPEFTLPYWNYSTSDPSTRGVIPPQFTLQNDPTFGPLFDGLRNPGVNQGQPIQGNDDSLLSLDSLDQTTYSPDPQQGTPGFNMGLDNGLHGNVHVLVGGGQNMGSVPFAARDPIFWMHHCNIDRLWASWNVAGNPNPPLSQQFTFADGQGQAVVANIADFLDLSKLNYTYDRFEPIPGAAPLAPAAVAAARVAAPARVAARVAQGAVALGATATQVKLNLTAPSPAFAAASVGGRVASVRPGGRVYLIARQLKAKAQPGVVYQLYLDLPPNPTPQQKIDRYVGAINFFGSANHGDAHGGAPVHGEAAPFPDKFVSYDITGKARALAASGALASEPVLTIIPRGQPDAAAEPVIGQIELLVH